MSDLQTLGRALMLIGALVAAFGAVLVFGPQIPWLGRLPGDVLIQRERFSLYVPVASCLLVSVILSVIFWLMGQFRR